MSASYQWTISPDIEYIAPAAQAALLSEVLGVEWLLIPACQGWATDAWYHTRLEGAIQLKWD